MLDHWLEATDEFTEKIKRIQREIEETAAAVDEVDTLITAPGIAAYSGLMIHGEIGEVDRFDRANEVDRTSSSPRPLPLPYPLPFTLPVFVPCSSIFSLIFLFPFLSLSLILILLLLLLLLLLFPSLFPLSFPTCSFPFQFPTFCMAFLAYGVLFPLGHTVTCFRCCVVCGSDTGYRIQ